MMAHHPAEMLAGLLNSQEVGFYSPRVLLNEARRKGIAILAPDIHLSGEGFSVEQNGGALRVGLSYCKGLSDSETLSEIIAEREKEPFSGVADLYRRTSVGRDVLTNLIRSGFLDSLGSSPRSSLDPRAGEARRALLVEFEGLPAKKRHKDRRAELPLPPREHPASWWSLREGRPGEELTRLPSPRGFNPIYAEWERDQARMLGLDVGDHPLARHRTALMEMGVSLSRDLYGTAAGSRVHVAGLLETLQAPPTRSGKVVHFLLTEDESGLLQSTIFSDCYRRCGHVLYETRAYLLEGRVEQDRRRGFSFVIEGVEPLGQVLSRTRYSTASETNSAAGGQVGAQPRSRPRRSAG